MEKNNTKTKARMVVGEASEKGAVKALGEAELDFDLALERDLKRDLKREMEAYDMEKDRKAYEMRQEARETAGRKGTIDEKNNHEENINNKNEKRYNKNDREEI